MGSVLSSAYASLCSFVNDQLDQAEVRRLMESFPQLRDMPAEERERKLRWLMVELEGHNEHPHPEADGDRLRPRPDVRYNYRHPGFRGNKNTSQ